MCRTSTSTMLIWLQTITNLSPVWHKSAILSSCISVMVTLCDFSMILIHVLFLQVQTQCYHCGIDFQSLHQLGLAAGEGQATQLNWYNGWHSWGLLRLFIFYSALLYKKLGQEEKWECETGCKGKWETENVRQTGRGKDRTGTGDKAYRISVSPPPYTPGRAVRCEKRGRLASVPSCRLLWLPAY